MLNAMSPHHQPRNCKPNNQQFSTTAITRAVPRIKQLSVWTTSLSVSSSASHSFSSSLPFLSYFGGRLACNRYDTEKIALQERGPPAQRCSMVRYACMMALESPLGIQCVYDKVGGCHLRGGKQEETA